MTRELRIADRLREYGLAVVDVDGWRTRGNETFAPKGVVCHHTAGAPTGELPSLRVLINGRSDLPGPLCHVGLARSGACYVVAAGRANHAGQGGWRGLSGNTSVFGIEAENDGWQPWPAAQLEAYYRCAAALLSLTPARDPLMVCGHKEWAPRRKPDPHTLDMNVFRARVRQILAGANPPPMPSEEEDPMNVDPGEVRPIAVLGRKKLVIVTDTLGHDAPNVPCRVAIGTAQGWRVWDDTQKILVPNGGHVTLDILDGDSVASVRNDGVARVDVTLR